MRASFLAWLERRRGTVDDYAFPSRINLSHHMSTRQYARLVDEWVTAIDLRPEEYGTHSLRRTKASMIYKATGNLRAIQILLGHSKIENTVRYLGVDVQDAEAVIRSIRMAVFGTGGRWLFYASWGGNRTGRFRAATSSKLPFICATSFGRNAPSCRT